MTHDGRRIIWAALATLSIVRPVSAAVDVNMDALGPNKNNNVANLQPVQVAKSR
jgi:hypothetical protein